jgi:hypothetical protein
VGARILKVALDMDAQEGAGMPPNAALQTLKERSGWYDPRILSALGAALQAKPKLEIRSIELRELSEGMMLGEDLRSEEDLVLVAKGQEVNNAMLVRLRQFARRALIKEPFRVLVPVQERAA